MNANEKWNLPTPQVSERYRDEQRRRNEQAIALMDAVAAQRGTSLRVSRPLTGVMLGNSTSLTTVNLNADWMAASEQEAPNLRRVIAGAIYDFAAALTTRKEPVTLGANHPAGPAATACEQFLRERGCSDGEPMVKDWREHLGAPLKGSEYDRHQHFIAEVKVAAMAAGLNYEAADRAARAALVSLAKAKVV